MMAAVPATAQSLPGGRPLDSERPASDTARPDPIPGPDPAGPGSSGANAGGTGEPAPGLRTQVGNTRDAVKGFIQAHVDLAKAELDSIKGEVARAAALGAGALAAVILLALLVSIGGLLFLGEWLFGSIGWGVLLGAELLIAVAVTAVLVALRIPGLGVDILVAAVIGVVVGIVLALGLPNQAFAWIGQQLGLGIDPAVRPLAIGALLLLVLGALAGLFLGARAGSGAAAIGGLFIGAIFGAIFGAFLSITFGPRAGAGLGVFTFLLVWPLLHAARVQRQGVDTEALKRRFYPATTIDTTKESIEWAKARMPGGPRS